MAKQQRDATSVKSAALRNEEALLQQHAASMKKMQTIADENQRAVALGQLHQILMRAMRGQVAEVCLIWREKATLCALQAETQAIVNAHEHAMSQAAVNRSAEKAAELKGMQEFLAMSDRAAQKRMSDAKDAQMGRAVGLFGQFLRRLVWGLTGRVVRVWRDRAVEAYQMQNQHGLLNGHAAELEAVKELLASANRTSEERIADAKKAQMGRAVGLFGQFLRRMVWGNIGRVVRVWRDRAVEAHRLQERHGLLAKHGKV